MLDWLIIGGGVHGTALSFHLTQRLGVKPDRLRVLDPFPAPLALWDHFTHNVGMAYLRSPGAHHLHHDPWSLDTFAETREGKPLAGAIPLYKRPSLALFNAHTHWLVERYRLDVLREQGRANRLTRMEHGWRVETEHGALEARHVLLAIGAGEQPHYPSWAAQHSHLPIHHIFDPAFNRAELPPFNQLVVVGGGITAAQTAIALADSAPGAVTLLMRHDVRVHPFDSDPCWLIRDCLDDYFREPDLSNRRQLIRGARHRGSLPPDVATALTMAVDEGRVRLLRGEVATAQKQDETMQLTLTDGSSISADRILLATGFETGRPGGAWLNTAIAEHSLPVAGDGYPVVDKTLCWSPGLYVAGPLAELELGPPARNIIGARMAGFRLQHAI